MYAGIPSSIDKTLFDTNPRAAASNWKAIGGYKDYQKFITGITLKNRFSSKVNNRFSVFGRGVDSYEKRPFNNLDDSSFGGGIRNKMSYHANKLDLLLGIEWITDKYNWQMDVEGKMINMNFEYRNHVNLFGMTYYRPSKKWNISLGGAINSVRYKLADKFKDNIDYSGIRNFPVIFSPRMGINFTPSNQLALFASVGQGFSMPSPEETLLPEGNINNEIEPEHGIQYEAGMRLYLFRNKTWIETAVYLINLNNLLVTKRLTEDIFTGINAGRTRHKGVEIMLKQEIFNNTFFPGNLFLNINYTFSHNIFKDFTDDDNVYNGKQLPGIPSHIYQTNFHWNLVKQFDLYFQGLFVGSQFINDANSIKNNAYFINNIKVVYHFFSNNSGTFSFYLGINNITNAHYSPMLTVNAVAFGNSEPRYYYPGMPVHWYTGLSWKL
jgi:iron complex outermembrane receptor protein